MRSLKILMAAFLLLSGVAKAEEVHASKVAVEFGTYSTTKLVGNNCLAYGNGFFNSAPDFCENGRVNAQKLFESLVAGKSSANWAEVLKQIRPELEKYHIGQQLDSSGNYRARLFLPTENCPNAAPPPSDFNAVRYGVNQTPACWEHVADVVTYPEGQWTWVDRGGSYLGAECGLVSSPPDTPEPPKNSPEIIELLMQQISLLQKINENFQKQNEALMEGLANLKAEISKGIKIRF